MVLNITLENTMLTLLYILIPVYNKRLLFFIQKQEVPN